MFGIALQRFIVTYRRRHLVITKLRGPHANHRSTSHPKPRQDAQSHQTSFVAMADIVKDAFLRSVLEASSHTQGQAITLVDLAASQSTSTLEPPSVEQQLELSKQQKLLYSYLAQLRGFNRDAILRVRQTKQSTAEARQEVDRLHLQLQNLYYEQKHLTGEIAACESYEYVSLQISFSYHPI